MFLSERKGEVIPCRGTKDRKGAGTDSGQSDMPAEHSTTDPVASVSTMLGGVEESVIPIGKLCAEHEPVWPSR